MDQAWRAWGDRVETRLAAVEKFVNVRKNDLRFKCDRGDFFEAVMDVAKTFDDLAEMRVWTSIAKRFDPEVGKELAERYEAIRKDLKDEKEPALEDLKLFADRAIDAMKVHTAMKYKGVWSPSNDYELGDTCTHDGSCWIATIQNKGLRPGDGQTWKLIVKRGKDGRDART
jgi:hypothetical protein